ncbi:hypothetical protein Tco_1358904, partial [Tanacetum coccineum]
VRILIKKDKNEAKTDKDEHGNGKSTENRGRRLIHEFGLEELKGRRFNQATGSPYGYLVANERLDLYSSSNLLLMIKKKEEKELGVGAYITACLLTKPSWQALPVRL